MTLRRIPIFSTIVVVAAAAVMVMLGFWQLGRLEEKEALIARHAANQQLPPIIDFALFPQSAAIQRNEAEGWQSTHLDDALFRTVQIQCPDPSDWKTVAGRNLQGQAGYVHMFVCDRFSVGFLDGGTIDLRAYATIGWSRSPEQPDWDGGLISGVLSTAGNDYEVIATEPVTGLAAVAPPDPNDLPNNHLAYAGQWFFFALTALVIYWLALRRRWRENP